MRSACTALFIVLSGALCSQPLTQSFNEPVVGDIDKNFKIDTSAFTTGLPNTVTGSSCNWDFTKLSAVFPLKVDSFVLASAALGGSAYPTASYVQHRDNFYTFYKSSSSPQQTELLGGTNPTLSLNFSNSAIVAQYPLNYGYTVSDPVAGTFKYNTTNGACNGNISVLADGQGTLSLPNGVFIPNVLRLKSVNILTLSVNIFPFATFNQTIYNYYMPGKKFPVLSVNYNVYQLIAGTATITATVYGSNDYFSVVGIHETQLPKGDYTVFPNPFRDELFIPVTPLPEENTYSFFNLNGDLVGSSGVLSAELTGKLLPGVYILQIKNSQGSFHQKIIKE